MPGMSLHMQRQKVCVCWLFDGTSDLCICLQDLVQRLESITIHWTRQIKEVVNQQVRFPWCNHSSAPVVVYMPSPSKACPGVAFALLG